ncbi:MAG: orotate phosphoribosyltransferase [Streptosporangiales bacterium]|nr:orotate phosphoribosyltransferase [Streptosporangiales bacterium]
MTLSRTGHFVFESGHHGDTWLLLDELVSYPDRLAREAEALAERLRRFPADIACGPLDGGAFVAQWVAATLGMRFTYARREPGPRYAIPREIAVDGLRALVVDDAVNLGSATMSTAAALADRGATVVAVGSLVACGPYGPHVGARLGVPQVYLTEVPSNVYPADACPLCEAGVPIDTGASRQLPASADRDATLSALLDRGHAGEDDPGDDEPHRA